MFELIKKAAVDIKGVIEKTPLIYSSSFSKSFGFECYLKLENLQKTGSFKARGAYNKIKSLSEKERKAKGLYSSPPPITPVRRGGLGGVRPGGVITASSGNHGQAVAWAASLLNMRSTIVMPEGAPIIKQSAARGYGGHVILHGNSFDEAYKYATELSQKKGMAFIPPFDDLLVIAGQGTAGLEIMEQLPDADAVVVPIGGGGLISGIAQAVKGIKRDIMVIGVEAEAMPSCTVSLKAGKPVQVEKKPTLADGIAVKKVGDITLPIIKEYVDEVLMVKEETLAAAILNFLERKKLVVEGAGAVSLAAAMEGKLSGRLKKVVFVVSGGNIDVTTLDRVIRLGLMKEGRIIRLSTVLEDSPGSLASLTALIASLKANILHILHERDAPKALPGKTRVEAILEVQGPAHGRRVLKGLKDKGYEV